MPRKRLTLAVFGLLLATLLASGSAELAQGMAYLAPFLLLLAVLAADRYPGERLIVALAGRAPRRGRPRPALPPRIRLQAFRPRGRSLLAHALAGRAPPGGGALIPTSST